MVKAAPDLHLNYIWIALGLHLEDRQDSMGLKLALPPRCPGS